jgi:hypothetical protein
LTSSLVEALAKPTPRRIGKPESKSLTSQIEVKGNVVEATVNRPATSTTEPEGEARELLSKHGLDPALFIVTGFRSSEWSMPGGGLGTSTRFTFARKGSPESGERPPIDDLVKAIKKHKPRAKREQGDHGFLVLLGDMQFGKIDGDGAEGTLRRGIDGLNAAADLLAWHRKRFDIGHVHIAWLGDHVEGFQSQGGANVWRTQLTLSEQQRLSRRLMRHAMETFAPEAQRLTMAAVPGNHGETVRFSGKGVTRYDDSHDTESLIALSEAAEYNPDAFGHVEFYVPETDEMTVVLDVAGTTIAHAHGHQFRPSKHLDWWQGQDFGGGSIRGADVLVCGHLHHELVEEQGWTRTLPSGEQVKSVRTFIQTPALEAESTWWRHAKGVTGSPGVMVGVTKDGLVRGLEVVR